MDDKCKAMYIRVSTEAQAEEGYSIAAQQERLEAYCTAMGWKNCRAYIDPGFSGSNLNRPSMQNLIADVKAKKVSAVIVFKLDRLSRSQKDTLFLIEDIFMPNDVDFISLNESIDTSTPYGRAMIGILSAFAQLERENIYLRTRMGMLERVKQGYWMGGGGTPFGYQYDRNSGMLVPHPEESKIVQKMYDLYLKGYSAQRIANVLNLKGDRFVTGVLSRKTNIGIITYKGTEYKGLHEPIIPEDIFNLTQIKMRERSQKSRTPTKSFHLLTGLVYCQCGSRMRYIKWGNNGYKLMCYSKEKGKSYMWKSDQCDNESVWAEEIEQAVIKDLFQLSLQTDNAQEYSMAHADPLMELEQQISQMELKIKRLYNVYAESGDDILLETIQENKETLLLLRQQYEMEEKTHHLEEHLKYVRSQVSTIQETWPLLSDQEKYSIVRDCVEKIVVYRNKVEIFYSFTK